MKVTDLITEFEWDDDFTKRQDDIWNNTTVAKTIGFSPRGELTKAFHRAIKLVSPDLAEPAIRAAAKAAAAEAERKLEKSQGVEEDQDFDTLQSDILGFMAKKMERAEQELQNAPATSPEEQENKEFALKLFQFMKGKIDQKANDQ